MKDIFDYTLEELEIFLVEMGFKKYNASQIFDWIYKKNIFDFSLMSNISKSLKCFLNDNFSANLLKVSKVVRDEKSSKYLLELSDGNKIECVLLKHDYGNSLCVSSQVGCNMGCAFCESGRLKKVRDLSLGEMTLQIVTVLVEECIRIDSVVVMGIGEPFDNFDVLKRFISVITCPYGLEIGQRHITVSTCGLVPKIKEFASLNTQVNLAISLHAGSDEVRNKLMNINRVYPIKDVFDALDFYISKTNRRVTIEYILIDGINDSEKDALDLVSLVKGKLMYVNLIPYNETSNFTFKRSNEFKINKFYDILKKNGINVIIRKNIASGINAACGQLRAKESA